MSPFLSPFYNLLRYTSSSHYIVYLFLLYSDYSPLSNNTSLGPILPAPNYITHTKSQFQLLFVTLLYSFSHILSSISIFPFHQLLSLRLRTSTNCTHSYTHAPTDSQHSHNHNKHSLRTVTYVAWRPSSRRQAVRQFWNLPDSSCNQFLSHFYIFKSTHKTNPCTILTL